MCGKKRNPAIQFRLIEVHIMGKVNHYIDDKGTLHIFVGDFSVADVRGCELMSPLEIKVLIDDILFDMGWIGDEEE